MTVAAPAGFDGALLATAFVFGLRHGIDWDHIAAIADITSSQDEDRKSMLFATLYALGHGLMVLALGVVAILLGDLLPADIDVVVERIVGLTLLVLGIYVFYALIRHGRDFQMRSRWMLIFSGIRHGVRWLRRRAQDAEPVEIVHEHEHPVDEPHSHGYSEQAILYSARPVVVAQRTHRHVHRHRAPMPDDPFINYGRVTSFGVGMIHGVGAETPTQVLLFLAAVGAGGRLIGLTLLVAFLVGLFTSNTVIALASTYGFLHAGRTWPVYVGVAVLTGAFSIVLGALYLVGSGSAIPAIFG